MADIISIAKSIFENQKAEMIIGYAKATKEGRTRPVVVRTLDEVKELVLNSFCLNNLSTYLTRKENKGKRVAIVAKGCDIKAIVQLIAENQIRRENVYVVGVKCSGVRRGFEGHDSTKIAEKCITCNVKTPHLFDELVEMKGEELPGTDEKAESIVKLEQMTANERFAYWEEQFERCIKCYACRQICPLCYCERCIADKSMPRWIETSPTKRGNFAWNIVRAFHLSGRCIGCNECERVCPAGIPLSLINRKMAKVAKSEFGYESGMDPNAPTLIGTYDVKDKEDFIR
ncbi:MAG: 4Fe-4S dicluster domain-containing protein [Deltaproteobacteria bacterium]|nr:4Fe-4S dicluster domain-containing protein [Deltaproteobacteria bacterium]